MSDTQESEASEASEASEEFEQLIVVSKTKELIKQYDFQCGGDFCDGLNAKINGLVVEALQRAKANNRKTVRASDL